ncbi:MAG: hypothetical protein QW182_07665, partial [Thermosphaera sp.]
QFYAPLNWEAITLFWIIDSQNNVLEGVDTYLERFVIFRYLHERSEPMEGRWRILAISSRSGVNARVSHIQEGDEEYYVSTPFHEYHSFTFDYMLKSFKVYAPPSRWLFIAAFNEKEHGRAWMFTFNNDLYQLDNYILYGSGSHYKIWEHVSEDTYIFFLAGSLDANISTSVITHNDLLDYEPQQPPQTITVTKTVTNTLTLTERIEKPYTVTVTEIEEVTLTKTDTNTITLTERIEEYNTLTEVKEVVLPVTETSTVTVMERIIEPYVTTTKESLLNTMVLVTAYINMLVLIIVVAVLVRISKRLS